jgi:glucose-6-phosphate isomerase
MSQVHINTKDAKPFIDTDLAEQYSSQVKEIISSMEQNCDDPDAFLGWLNLPEKIDNELLENIEATARSFKDNYDSVVFIGIGGSYLGAKAVIHALSPFFKKKDKNVPDIYYAGHNLDEDYHYELLEELEDKNYGVVVISKSGTTTEPGIAFRVISQHLERKVGKEEAAKRIIAITDKEKGALKTLANQEGYKTFVIPDNVGGRYSVLTPVGLVPIAIAGINIRDLIEGAENMRHTTTSDIEFEKNPAAIYAALRNELYKQGKSIEILGIYNSRLRYMMEWWKQLFGESEGKEGKGIFPATVEFTTDLHSMGQYIQEGQKMHFETIISLYSTENCLTVPSNEEDLDNLNYLSEKRIHEINIMAEAGTRLAHTEGDVPNICLALPANNAYNLGQLIYFFEKACAISGKLLGVNPFNQPGVESYKNNMFALLQKPGYETDSQKYLDIINEQKSDEKLF